MESQINYYLIGWVACVSLGMVQFGYMMGEFTLISDILPWIYNFQYGDINVIKSILTTVGPAGAFFGAIAAGPMSYRSRRFWLFFANYLVMISVCLRMMPFVYVGIISRLLFGFAVGIFSTIVPLFIIEISPIHLKGTNGTSIQLGITTGILLAYLMGYTAPDFEPNIESNVNYCLNYHAKETYWRAILAFPFIISLLQTLLLLFVYKLDTPKYYWIVQDFISARSSLTKIHLKISQLRINGSFTSSAEDMLLDAIDYIDPNPDGRSFYSLTKKKYRRAFLVGVMLWIIQQMSGINLIIFYVNKVVTLSK